nr:uncharacterized protein LOC123745114 isoform X1 [Procambarus clarkii]
MLGNTLKISVKHTLTRPGLLLPSVSVTSQCMVPGTPDLRAAGCLHTLITAHSYTHSQYSHTTSNSSSFHTYTPSYDTYTPLYRTCSLSSHTHTCSLSSHTHTHWSSHSTCDTHKVVVASPGCGGNIMPHVYPVAGLHLSSVARKIRSKVLDKHDAAVDAAGKRKAQQNESPMIILIDTEDKLSVITLLQAYRMAKRRDLKVVKVEDSSLKTKDKQVYKLMTGKQYFEETKTKKTSKSSVSKGEKLLTMSGKIASHDLELKLQKLKKWLGRGYSVKITITAGQMGNKEMENISVAIQEEVESSNGRILQQQSKLGYLKFFISPPKVNQNVDTKEAKIELEEEKEEEEEETNETPEISHEPSLEVPESTKR